MSDYREYILDFFRKYAPYYDLMAAPLLLIRDVAVKFCKAKPGFTVLDVCTGTGSQAFAFAKAGCSVTGIDLSEDMLRIAKKKNKKKKVKFEIGDASAMAYPDDSFDISCIFFSLHDMPLNIRHKVLDEMKRVSKEILIVDYNFPKNNLLRWLYMLLPSLFESRYYQDFSMMEMGDLLSGHGLTTIKKRYLWFGSVIMLLCRKSRK
jgi:ubiquinone/menaquinone biosynthesis C-methylase UbiE